MTSKQLSTELSDTIADALAPFGYSECETDNLGRTEVFTRLMTPRKWMVRYLCVVTEIPIEIQDLPTCLAYFEDLRGLLTKQYAQFPWFKELGTYSVLICRSELYDKLRNSIHKFKDGSGFHMNVMLGACFVDRSNFRNSADSTWGLHYSGKHFGAIGESVRKWCFEMTERQPTA